MGQRGGKAGKMDRGAEPTPARHPPNRGVGGLFLLLVFGFGTAAGLLLAFVAAGLVEESGGLIITVFLSAAMVVAGLGLLLAAFRRPILRRLFGYAETQVEMFADPMARVAASALERDARGATMAARDLVALGLARYSWLAARRWLIASLTALIAAMAALAGTALLFKQNTLIETQTQLLSQQNDKIEAQTVLLRQDLQLAEAARNAAIAVAITDIAALIGAAADRTAAEAATVAPGSSATADRYDAMVNVIDPATDLDHATVLRIVSLSRAAKPYRFLDTGLLQDDPNDRLRVAMLGRRDDLPKAWARMADAYGWSAPGEGDRLIDRPVSPERGQLLQILLSGGVRDLGVLNHFGLDLSFADFQNADVILMNAQGGRFSYSDFSGAQMRESDLGGAAFENARFRRADIRRCTFAAVSKDRLKPPFPESGLPYSSFLSGADFSSAYIGDTDFSGAMLLAARFDGALLANVDFTGAVISAASLRNAVILGGRFAGADLKSVDLDGAVVFGADFLDRLAAATEPGRFVRERFVAHPITMPEVMRIGIVSTHLSQDELAGMTGGQQPYRLQRVADMED